MYANKIYLIDVPPRHYWHPLPKFNILENTDVPVVRCGSIYWACFTCLLTVRSWTSVCCHKQLVSQPPASHPLIDVLLSQTHSLLPGICPMGAYGQCPPRLQYVCDKKSPTACE